MNHRVRHQRRDTLTTAILQPCEGMFEVGFDGDTMIVTPVGNLGELAFREIEAGADEVLSLLKRTRARNVVVDLHRMDYSGSTALGFFIQLAKMVRSGKGRLAFCNTSEHEKEI